MGNEHLLLFLLYIWNLLINFTFSYVTQVVKCILVLKSSMYYFLMIYRPADCCFLNIRSSFVLRKRWFVRLARIVAQLLKCNLKPFSSATTEISWKQDGRMKKSKVQIRMQSVTEAQDYRTAHWSRAAHWTTLRLVPLHAMSAFIIPKCLKLK